MTERSRERLALLFVLGVLLVNFPVLAIFHQSAMIWGIPVLYLYLFGVWTVGIVAAFVTVNRRRW